jgi:hypothetical protein
MCPHAPEVAGESSIRWAQSKNEVDGNIIANRNLESTRLSAIQGQVQACEQS